MIRVYILAFAAATKGFTFVPHWADLIREERDALCRAAATISRNLRRALCVALILSLLATSTPAAPRTIVSVAQEWRVSLGFWLRANGLPRKLYGAFSGQDPRSTAQERQEDRDARVSRIQIYPGDVTISLADRVVFAAVAYDHNGAPIGGVKFKWSAQDTVRSRAAHLSARGEFEPPAAGVFTVMAEGAGRTAQVRAVVLPGGIRRRGNEPLTGGRSVSTRDVPSLRVASTKAVRKQLESGRAGLTTKSGSTSRSSNSSKKRAHVKTSIATAAVPWPQEDGWNDGNYWSADDPGNRLGNAPGAKIDGGAGSGNFQFAAPISGAAGRGISIAVELSHNSRLWNKAAVEITSATPDGSGKLSINEGKKGYHAVEIGAGPNRVKSKGTITIPSDNGASWQAP